MALKHFEAKILPEILYKTQTGFCLKKEWQIIVQTKFQQSILAAPDGTSNALLSLDTVMPLIQIRMWKMVITYWLKMQFFPVGLTPLVLTDNFSSPWKQVVEHKLSSLHYS